MIFRWRLPHDFILTEIFISKPTTTKDQIQWLLPHVNLLKCAGGGGGTPGDTAKLRATVHAQTPAAIINMYTEVDVASHHR